MECEEKIKVYINIQGGKTVCICKRDRKGCNKACDPDIVKRDKFEGWKDTFRHDRYGRSPGKSGPREE